MRKSFPQTTKWMVYNAQHGYCRLCDQPMTDWHHRVPNTKTNANMFPAFIHSIFNCVGLCRACHDDRKAECHITLDEAKAYETWLRMVVGCQVTGGG